jgi:hypothetical protein
MVMMKILHVVELSQREVEEEVFVVEVLLLTELEEAKLLLIILKTLKARSLLTEEEEVEKPSLS